MGTTTTTTFTPTTGDVPEPTLASSTGSVPTTGDDSTTGDSTGSTSSNPHPTTTGVLPDFGPDGPDCGGKIDILFAFDTADNLDVDYPKLEAALQETLPQFIEWFGNFDTHWMVANTRFGWGIAGCEAECSDNDGVMCWPVGPPSYPCEAYEGQLSECDTTYGAAVTFPAGFDAANKRCELAGGERFAQSSESDDLLSELECITQTGWTDVDGLQAEGAIVYSLRPIMTKVPGGCNLGFLRDDALLLVIYFSKYGGVDDSVAGPPQNWADEIYAAKGGNQDKVVVLGIAPDKTLPDPVCPKFGDVDYWTEVEQFLHFHIKHGLHGSLCADDYAPFLREALELSLALCGEEPPT